MTKCNQKKTKATEIIMVFEEVIQTEEAGQTRSLVNFVSLVGFLMSPSTTRLYRGRAPKLSV